MFGDPNAPKMNYDVAYIQKQPLVFQRSKMILQAHMGVSENSGTPKSSILIGISIIFTIHFGVPPFSETSTWIFSHRIFEVSLKKTPTALRVDFETKKLQFLHPSIYMMVAMLMF